MRLRGRHAGLAGQVLQRQRPPVMGQGHQQLAAYLHALDAPRAAGVAVFAGEVEVVRHGVREGMAAHYLLRWSGDHKLDIVKRIRKD